MQTNNLFSFHRFLLLCKQSLIINKKIILTSIIGMSGALFIIMLFLQSIRKFSNWAEGGYLGLFFFCFVVLGAIYISNSFPAFRSKETSMAYLMLPATTYEKFLFEFLSRIVLFILVMPLLFVCVLYFETFLVRQFVTGFEQFTISKLLVNNQHIHDGFPDQNLIKWTKYAIIQNGLLVIIIIFTGASHFMKSPFAKTFFTVTVINIGFGIFTYLITKALGIVGEHTRTYIQQFPKDGDHIIIFFAILVTIFNLSLLAMAFFRLKEKEV